jgi:signal transduction histidine kinase
MLDEFIGANRDVIIESVRARVATRGSPKPSVVELTNGIPVFLGQLRDALHLAKTTDVVDHHQLNESASRYGAELFRMGLSIRQVVHDYGAVCQTITELAVQNKAPIDADEFRVLNLCLDDAIAAAVTEYSSEHEREIAGQGTERRGIFAHEMRSLLNTAILAFESIKTGRVAVGGSTGLLHSRSLAALRDLIDLTLADARLDAGSGRAEPISVASFIDDVEINSVLQAQARGLHLTFGSVDGTLTIDGDRQVLAAVLSNLLMNAFKFTRKRGNVSLTTRATAERILFEIEDECGGLPGGDTQGPFSPFEQSAADRSGVGLGLSICLKGARANAGDIYVRDLPGKGCIFTLDLPRIAPAPLASA